MADCVIRLENNDRAVYIAGQILKGFYEYIMSIIGKMDIMTLF